MPLHETRSRFSHAEPGTGVFQPNAVVAGQTNVWDEPVTAEIPRKGDAELIRGCPRRDAESISFAGPRGRTGRASRHRRPGEPVDPAMSKLRSQGRPGKRTVYSDRGERWPSYHACAKDLTDEAARSGLHVSYWFKNVDRAIRTGEQVAGRHLFTATPAQQQQEDAA